MSRRAFTLVELVVVTAIVAVLAGVSAAGFYFLTQSSDEHVSAATTLEVRDTLRAKRVLDAEYQTHVWAQSGLIDLGLSTDGPVSSATLSTDESTFSVSFRNGTRCTVPYAEGQRGASCARSDTQTAQPANVSASASVIVWNDTGAAYYELRTSCDAGQTWQVSQMLTPDQTQANTNSRDGCLVVVRSYTDTGSYADSSPLEIPTPERESVFPDQVEGVEVVAQDGTFTLTWPAVPKAASYVYEYQNTAGGPVVSDEVVGVATAVAAWPPGTNAGDDFAFRVAAVNDMGQGLWSAQARARVPYPPDPPYSAAAEALPGSVRVTWQVEGSSGVTGYTVRYRPAQEVAWTQAGTTVVSIHEFLVEGLSSYYEYEFQVVSTGPGGESTTGPVVIQAPLG